MGMRLSKIRIQNYRIIEDTGWIDIDNDVTALIGINESGKTAILEALFKLNPSSPAQYDMLAEFPHDRLHGQKVEGSHIPVASAQFQVTDELRENLRETGEIYAKTESIECTRYYDNSLTVDFYPDIPLEDLTSDKVNAFLAKAQKHVQTSKVPEKQIKATGDIDLVSSEESPPPPSPKEILVQYRENLLKILGQAQNDLRLSLTESQLSDRLRKLTIELRSRSSDDWQEELIHPLLEQIEELIDIEEAKASIQVAERIVKEHLPVFIYFEDYSTLRGDIFIPDYLAKSHLKDAPKWVRTANALFKLAEYPLTEVAKLYQQTRETAAGIQQQQRNELQPNEEDKIKRAIREATIRSEASSLRITDRFNEWWPVGDYKIHLRPTEQYFELRVSDQRRNITVELEYRSRGFQYFLSFFLVFEAETDGGHKDSILLLDEPGLHLHPEAQKRLLAYFESLSEKNQVLYSSHSPFMIDGRRLDRVRAVMQRKGDGETIVTDYLGSTKNDATLVPIQSALGYSISQTLFMGKRCLIVEGWTDFWTLKMLDKMMADASKESLDPDIYVTPTGGTNNIPWMAQFIASQDVPYIVLLDSDKAGESLQQRMIRDLVALSGQFVMLGDITGQPGTDLEALFPSDYFLKATAQAYSIPEFDTKALKLRQNEGLAEAIKRYFDSNNYPAFDKGKVYLWLVRKWATQSLDELPSPFVSKIEQVFREINKRFEELEA